ncbi:MAG: hypothetical protein QOK43_2837 [Acidimicrobiaceae bacterium]|nr:hypothetical protein [Acidimicrobiaceae bacterium]
MWVALAALGLSTAYVLWEVHILLVLRNTTTTFAELGMHLNEPAYLRDHVLPSLSGWSPEFFGGAPVGTFYFPLTPMLGVVLNLVLPYNVAFKLSSVLGLCALPACAYAFGRLHDRDRLTSSCLAVGTLPFLLLPTTAVGGSISAAVSSEYGYSLALAAAMLALGLAGKGLRTGRYRAATSVALSAALLLHYLPGAMAFVGVVVLAALRPSRAALRWVVPVLFVGAATAGFSVLPFVALQRYSGGPVYGKGAGVGAYLLFVRFAPVIVAGCLGAIAAIRRATATRDRFGLFLVIMAAIAAVVFSAIPQGRLWNARFVPFWYLWLSLLAGYAVAEFAGFVDRFRRELARGRPVTSPWATRLMAPFAALVLVAVFWDSPFARGLVNTPRYDISHLSQLAYEGYEDSADKAEFRDFISTARRVAHDHGCGRALWEWNDIPDPANPTWEDPRTGLATMLPYWTGGCLGSMQGLFVQASATAPYVSTANGHLAGRGHAFDVVTPAPHLNVAAGLEDLRLLGVRYYFAVSPEAKAQADITPGLNEVARTKDHGPWSWTVYEVSELGLVEPVQFEPVVASHASRSIGSWQNMATTWFSDTAHRAVLVTDGGPAEWQRTKADTAPAALPQRRAPATVVSRVHLSRQAVSFDVSTIGVPVLVKVSYFPNWKAEGADGPWRATPNYMVVVPNSHHVTLRYRHSNIERLGWLITAAGLAGVVWLIFAGPTEMPIEEAPEPTRVRPQPPKKAHAGRRKGKRR